MKFFGQLIRTAVNVAVLPVAIVKDVVMAPLDLVELRGIGDRTSDQLEKLKDEAGEEPR